MSSKKRQAKIYQFDPMIYPRFLWVVTGGDYSDIKKWFQACDGEEIEESDVNHLGGLTISVIFRQNQCFGILIWFPKIHLAKANWITHESTHGALELFDQVGARIDYRNQEPFAYLSGWFAECIEFVKTGKANALKLEKKSDESNN